MTDRPRLEVDGYIEDWRAELKAAKERGDEERAAFCLRVIAFNEAVRDRLLRQARSRRILNA